VEAGAGEFPEDAWVGRVLRIGGLRMRVDQRDQRCVVVTIDPVTLGLAAPPPRRDVPRSMTVAALQPASHPGAVTDRSQLPWASVRSEPGMSVPGLDCGAAHCTAWIGQGPERCTTMAVASATDRE